MKRHLTHAAVYFWLSVYWLKLNNTAIFSAAQTLRDVCPLRGVLVNSDVNTTRDEEETQIFLNRWDH